MSARQAAAPAPADLRRVLGRFLTGVTVLTAVDDGDVHGMTANSFTSVSLEPPLVLVCLDPGARTAAAVERSRRVTISVLGAGHAATALRFARRGGPRYPGPPPVPGADPPAVPDALAELRCTVEEVVVAGDHHVVLCRVRSAKARAGSPLGFFEGRFCDVVARDTPPVPPWY
ncbi:hypothetical protein BJF78_30245 [Pseudonocardia sp. CNS-139]|nr:hypothetical protein BJF78_30245 [Pseudonocardia sp. CNS-139]